MSVLGLQSQSMFDGFKQVTYLFKYPTNFSLFLATRTGVHLWRMYGFIYMKRKHYNQTQ